MTGEEKRRQLKEQFKQDLRLRKEFLDKAQELKRSQKMNKAITELTSSLNMEETDEWIEALNKDAMLSEAKMEMSLEDADLNVLEKEAKEAENKKFSAEQLVHQMKKEMGLVEEVPGLENAPDEASESDQDEEPPAPQSPGKKLGDF